ncbi:hypothetical protein C4J81_09955 [Deltaproteobacteria bacterium Smac51]|nr:hypothetical protein C4J81_09955 [Deltaproteobacteria bacterium Smac51]
MNQKQRSVNYMAKKNHYGPYTARPGKTGTPWLLYLTIAAVIVALGFGVWYVAAPESLARVHGRFLGPDLQIHSLAVNVDRRLMEIAPNGSIEVHPRQNFTIQGLNTNRWRNYDLRLYSPDFDIAHITGGASSTPLALLGEEALESAGRLRIEAKDGATVRAVFEITSHYTAVDLAAMGDAAPEPARKAALYQKAFDLDSSSKTLREKLIDALVEAERKPEAALMLEDGLKSDGPNQQVLSRLLNLYTEIGENEKSIDTLNRLIELARKERRDPSSFQTQLAALYRKMNRGGDAAAVYENMISEAADDGTKATLLEEMRSMYREEGRSDQEISTLKRLLEVAPENRAAGIWAEIITLYERLGDIPGQHQSWLALAELLPDGPNKANAYKRAAYLLAGAESYGEAAKAYEAALVLDPEDINIHLNLGRLALAQNDRAAYRSHLEKALALDSGRDDLRRELAEALYDDGLKTEAEHEYDLLLEKDSNDQTSRLRLIGILEDSGGREERLRDEYAKLVAAQPANKVAAYNLAVLCFRGELWDEAIAAFKNVLELDPEDLDARGYLLSAYEKKGDTENMLGEALEIYRRDPSRNDYRELLINSYENAANWTKLSAVAEEIVRLEPKDVEGWRLLSRVQARLAKPVESARSLYKAAEAAGTNKEYWFAAAEALSVQNQLGEAKEAYQKILALEPENKRAAEALLEISLRELSTKQK